MLEFIFGIKFEMELTPLPIVNWNPEIINETKQGSKLITRSHVTKSLGVLYDFRTSWMILKLSLTGHGEFQRILNKLRSLKKSWMRLQGLEDES